ncbi:MAG: hypothetical protein PHT33_00780 [bacterium]|nr:hypothetical protein [bacterium]
MKKARYGIFGGIIAALLPVISALFLSSCLADGVTAADERKPLPGRTMVYSRSQTKYGLYQNYLHTWIDRPLLHNRDTRPVDGKPAVMTYPSFSATAVSAGAYGLDGFAVLVGTPGMLERYTTSLQYADEMCSKGQSFAVLTEFGGVGVDRMLETYGKVLESALASKSAVRFNGKILVTSYNAGATTPQQWKSALDKLRERYGDCFIFLPDLGAAGCRLFFTWSDNKDSLSSEELERYKATLRSYLDVTDGLYFATPHPLRKLSGTGLNEFARKFYEEIAIASYRSVLSERPYRNKYFALGACNGYVNYVSGSSLMENGTKTLRDSFEAAMNARPDIIILPEWDEVNENTCIQPTVYNSFSTQRIIKYYMQRIKGEAPTPNPGDDTSIPNLIVSYRKMIKLGEPVDIELLNVPDSGGKELYTAQLSLKSVSGKVLKTFPKETFTIKDLRDKTYRTASEEFSGERVLIPSLAVVDSKGKTVLFEQGLHHIQLRPTWTWDYKCVKQPLRDILKPVSAAFAVEAGKDGSTLLKAGVECKEEIASAEVLEDGDEIYACDKDDEYRMANGSSLIRLTFAPSFYTSSFTSQTGGNGTDIKGTVTLEGNGIKVVPEGDKQRWYTLKDGKSIKLSLLLRNVPQVLYVSVPPGDISAGSLNVDLNLFKLKLPVKKVLEEGIYAETAGRGVVFCAERYDRLPDHPYHTGSRKVEFTARLYPQSKASVLQVRIITKSGKVFWSNPIFNTATSKAIALPVWSGSKQAVVKVKTGREEIPCLKYNFDSGFGTILSSPAGRSFYGILGGAEDVAIGKGRTGSSPFVEKQDRYPATSIRTAPEWVKEDGAAALKFDGIGNYIILPREALPRGSYTMDFEIKAESSKDQVLLKHQSNYTGSLEAGITGGKLYIVFTDETLKDNRYLSRLEIPVDKWCKIRISYDLAAFTLAVDDKRDVFAPVVKRPAFLFAPLIWGGYGSDNKFFEGYLRALTIDHAPAGEI